MKKNVCIKILVLLIILTALGCSKSAPTTPDPPEIPDTPTGDCQIDSTAWVTFKNNSNSNTTYDVIWDGAKKVTITPGTTSPTYTVPSGQHTMKYVVTNTNTIARAQENLNLQVCSSSTYYCYY